MAYVGRLERVTRVVAVRLDDLTTSRSWNGSTRPSPFVRVHEIHRPGSDAGAGFRRGRRQAGRTTVDGSGWVSMLVCSSQKVSASLPAPPAEVSVLPGVGSSNAPGGVEPSSPGGNGRSPFKKSLPCPPARLSLPNVPKMNRHRDHRTARCFWSANHDVNPVVAVDPVHAAHTNHEVIAVATEDRVIAGGRRESLSGITESSPKISSAPLPPHNTSCPPSPRTKSSPPRPAMTSTPGVPMSSSAPFVPTTRQHEPVRDDVRQPRPVLAPPRSRASGPRSWQSSSARPCRAERVTDGDLPAGCGPCIPLTR